ncbi:MAG TPA: hypothetical protein VES42_28370 [Pilimelia sp.]|nr:hypothetical protein [Pilimelia sp.]
MRTISVLLAAVLATALAGGCEAGSAEDSPPAAAGRSATPAYGPAVVHLDGVRGLRFGATEADLTARGVVVRDVPGCGPRAVDTPGATPVFVAGTLALVWADQPLRTPDGVSAGDPVAKVRAAHPNAVELRAPRGSYRFDGLLAPTGDRAYLFLHDGRAVRKLIVGYADAARALFNEGFSGC